MKISKLIPQLETTLKYLDQVNGGLDFDSLDPNNKRKTIEKMSSASKGVISTVFDSIKRAAQERERRS